MKLTRSLVQVAMALMDDPDAQHWGYELGKKAGVRSGVLYPMLSRLLDQGLLTDGWEDPSAISGRPPRRYYRLTDQGKAELGAALRRAESSVSAVEARLNLGWA